MLTPIRLPDSRLFKTKMYCSNRVQKLGHAKSAFVKSISRTIFSIFSVHRTIMNEKHIVSSWIHSVYLFGLLNDEGGTCVK